MADLARIAQLLVDHTLKRYPDSISLIACYGSYANGTSRPDSDLDIFYTPVDGTSPSAARQFIVEGIPCDFWPISWQMLRGFATGETRPWAFAPSLVAGARLLYTRSEADRVRFADLQSLTRKLQSPESRPEMVRRALGAFTMLLSRLGQLDLAIYDGDRASIRMAAAAVVLGAIECLALVNQRFLPRGANHIAEHLDLLPDRPDDFADRITAIMTSADPLEIKNAAHQMAIGIRDILRCNQERLPTQERLNAVFSTAYPEIREHINKLHAASRGGFALAMSLEACSLQNEISLMLAEGCSGLPYGDFNLYREYARFYTASFPDLVAATFTPATRPMLAEVQSLDSLLREWLLGRSIGLQTYESIEDLDRSLQASET